MNNCPIEKRELCKFIGSEGCENCRISQIGKKADPKEFADNWDVTLSLLPDDIDELHTTDYCKFCKGEPEKKVGYEFICLKHKEPIHKKGIFFGYGTKVDGDVGSLVDMPITVCKKCRRRILLDKYLTLIGAGIGILLGLIVVLLPGIESKLSQMSWILPLLVFLVIAALGYVVTVFMKKSLRKSFDLEMHIDPLTIPQISKMMLLDWKPMQANKKGEPILCFKKKKLRENMRYKSFENSQKEDN